MSTRKDRLKVLAARPPLHIGALQVHPGRLVVIADNTEIRLELRMMEVLVMLADHAGALVSKDKLLEKVWLGTHYGDGPVEKAVSQLRTLIGDDARAPRYIETGNHGYRLIPKVISPDDHRDIPAQDAVWLGRCPYVGLDAFDDRYKDVFCGRKRMTDELLGAMRKQIDNQRRFVFLVGASGCGKTSLLRAGVLPKIRQKEGWEGLRALALATCNLSAAQGGDIVEHLAAALATWSLDERPVFDPQSNADLAHSLIKDTGNIAHVVDRAFSMNPDRRIRTQPHAHLLLVIDHAEALVASKSVSLEERADFSRVVDAICGCARTLVVMIARSDYPQLIESMPDLAERKAGEGHVHVLTPRQGEIKEIIRVPAEMARLSFETDRQSLSSLDEVLRDAAVEQPDVLPLLQHTLQSLYELRSESGLLTFAAYNEIGGLEGALARHAEEVYGGLPEAAQASLGHVLSLIVTESDNDTISAHHAHNAAIRDENAQRLVDAFIDARLFVGSLDEGRPCFEAAHEALLRQWKRAESWIRDNRRLVRARAGFQRAAATWEKHGRRDDHLLNAGRPLDEAREIISMNTGDITGDEKEFFRDSEKFHRRKKNIRNGAISALACLTLASLALMLIAMRASEEADQRKEEAQVTSGYMLGELVDTLDPKGDQRLMDSIADKALSIYERRPLAALDPKDLINYSRALRMKGKIAIEKARIDLASAYFQRASAAARRAGALEPESPEAMNELGQSEFWLGYFHHQQGRLNDATKHWRDYLKASERLLGLEPENPAWQQEFSYALNNLGTVARDQGHYARALDYFTRSAKIKAEVLATDIDNAKFRYDLIDTQSWVSSSEESLGELKKAAAGYKRQIGELRKITHASGDAIYWKTQLANLLQLNAHLSASLGKMESAKEQIDESVEILLHATGKEPENQAWRRYLANARMEAGDIASARGDNVEAARQLAAAREQSRTLEASEGSLPAWQRMDASIRCMLAMTESPRDLEKIDEAVDDLARLSENFPYDIHITAALARALAMRGAGRAEFGDADGAARDWRRVNDLLDAIAPTSKDAKVLMPWVSANIFLGKQPDVAEEIGRLKSSGYAHPEFVAIVDGKPQMIARR